MKKLLAIMLALLVCVGLTACSNNGGKTEDPEEKTFVIGMLNANRAEPWNVQMDADVEAAASKYDNVKIVYKDCGGDASLQRSQIEEFINSGVDGLLISPVEADPLTPVVEEAHNAGIPIVLISRNITSDAYDQYVCTDNFALGYAAGQWVINNVGADAGVVMLNGLMTDGEGYDRALGFKRAIEGTDIEILWEQDCQWDEAQGRSEMESVLSVVDPEKIDVVFGGNDPTAHGAYVACQAAGVEEGIKFFGIDGLENEGRVYVDQGVFAMTIFDATGGDIAMDTMMDILSGKTVNKTYVKQAIIFEKDTLTTGGTAVPAPDASVDRTGQQIIIA